MTRCSTTSRGRCSREEVARYLQGTHGESAQARERIYGYLDELKTTQRYSIYRALKHPLYPILRKIDRHAEGTHHAAMATAAGRVIYASNHRSHIDYLVEPLALDEAEIRPPIMAAGINLFGGPLGLIHRHVTGAPPIRRNAKDPAYLITLKAYVAELLDAPRPDVLPGRRPQLQRRAQVPEDGPHARGAARAEVEGEMVVVPCAIAYDIVIEDFMLARQKVKRSQRGFGRELAEMVRSGVGFGSRVFVSFGAPIPVDGYDPHSSSEVLELAHRTRNAIGRLRKVLPTALVAAAAPVNRAPGAGEPVSATIMVLAAGGANMGVVERARRSSRRRGRSRRGASLVVERGRFRIRERNVLRYYARSLEHLLHTPGRTGRTDNRRTLQSVHSTRSPAAAHCNAWPPSATDSRNRTASSVALCR